MNEEQCLAPGAHSSPLWGGEWFSDLLPRPTPPSPALPPLSLAPHICQSSQLLSPSPPTSPFRWQQSLPSQPKALAPPTASQVPPPSALLPVLIRSAGTSRSWSFFMFFLLTVLRPFFLKHVCLHCLVLGNHLWFKEISKKKASDLKKNAPKPEQKGHRASVFKKLVTLPYHWKGTKQNNKV